MVIWQPEIDNAEHPYPIFTRSGWEIPQPTIDEVDQAQQDLGDVRADTRKLLGLLRQVNWQGNIVRSVSQHLYSCVGMVFANRRAWIEPDSLHRILREDGYTKLTNVENLSVGDVVLYHLQGKPVHVGVVTEVSKENGHIIRLVRY